MITQTRAAFFFPKQKSSRMGIAVSIGFVTNARPPPSPPRTKKQIVINTISFVRGSRVTPFDFFEALSNSQDIMLFLLS